jgi:hypothetical protein
MWPAPFFVVVIRSLPHGLAGFPCYMIWAAGALLLAMAIGVWVSPVRGMTREKTLAAFIFFLGIYFFAALAAAVPSDPVRCLLLGAGLQALGLALLAIFPSYYRSLTRVALSSPPDTDGGRQ